MSIMELICGLLIILLAGVSTTSKVVIVTPLGPVEGQLITSYDHADYHAFKGIRYAQPPVGKLRFQAPRPVRPWTEIYRPPARNIRCVQEVGGYISGDEDCLYVHVYTPVNSSTALSVMVYLHGGGYKSGSAELQNEVGHLMAKGVIVVSISYRLGPFGFLSTEDSEASGNYGLLDQITALIWIQQNIASFGGDPKSVTLFGSGSGASMAHMLMLTPLAKGLFHRAIFQSGCAINPSSITKISLIRAQTLAEQLECPKAPSSQLLKCLRQRHAQEIAYAGMANIDEMFGNLPIMWAPRVDAEATAPVLPKSPYDLMLLGYYSRIPVMTGFVRDEGLAMYGIDDTSFENQYGILKDNMKLACLRLINGAEFVLGEKQLTKMCAKVKKHYVDKDNYNNVVDQRYIDLIGDVMVRSGILKTVKLMVEHSPFYVYHFDFFDEIQDTYERYIDSDDKVILVKGVTHGKELDYIFNKNLYKKDEDEEEMISKRERMTEIMTTAWTSFAKTGKPQVINASSLWLQSSDINLEYMTLNLASSLKKNYRKKDMNVIEDWLKDFWYKTKLPIKDEL